MFVGVTSPSPTAAIPVVSNHDVIPQKNARFTITAPHEGPGRSPVPRRKQSARPPSMNERSKRIAAALIRFHDQQLVDRHGRDFVAAIGIFVARQRLHIAYKVVRQPDHDYAARSRVGDHGSHVVK